MWIIIAQIICLAAAIGLLAIAYDLDHETPSIVRYPLVCLSVVFFAVFMMTHRNRELYEHAAAIAFTGVGTLVIAGVIYLILSKQMQPIVMKVTGGALGLSLLLWVVGSCSDIKRQELQIENSDVLAAPTSPTVTVGDSTQQAIDQFRKLSN